MRAKPKRPAAEGASIRERTFWRCAHRVARFKHPQHPQATTTRPCGRLGAVVWCRRVGEGAGAAYEARCAAHQELVSDMVRSIFEPVPVAELEEFFAARRVQLALLRGNSLEAPCPSSAGGKHNVYVMFSSEPPSRAMDAYCKSCGARGESPV